MSEEKQSSETQTDKKEPKKEKSKGFFGRLFSQDKSKDKNKSKDIENERVVEETQSDAAEVSTESAEAATLEQADKPEIEPSFEPEAAELDVTETPVAAIDEVEKIELAEEASIKPEVDTEIELPDPAPETKPAETQSKSGFFSRIKGGLGKTRGNLTSGLMNILVGRKEIDDEIFEELETQLLMADVGVEATLKIIDNLTERAARKDLIYTDALYKAVQEQLADLLNQAEAEKPLSFEGSPTTIMVVGVNGVGKTTSIGKLAYHFRNQKHKTMLAAGDTFRAAAVEQLQVWGERNDIPVVAQKTGSDSAAVAYDGLQSAKAKDMDVLIVDTAGRLHNKSHLMDELKKVKRVMSKLDEDAPHETWLVIDAGTGQNALRQVKEFHETLELTGLIVTKMDGTAKGGIVFALAQQFNIPIRFIGVGEQITDLRPFDAPEFVAALFEDEE